MTKKWLIRTGYVGSFAASHAAAWYHVPWLALGLAGVGFLFLSRAGK